jgi:hypothetical protein
MRSNPREGIIGLTWILFSFEALKNTGGLSYAWNAFEASKKTLPGKA